MSNLLQQRYASERRFKLYGRLAMGFAVACLIALLLTLTIRGATGFFATDIQLNITFDAEVLGIEDAKDMKQVPMGSYYTLLQRGMRDAFVDVETKPELRALYGLVSLGATRTLRTHLKKNPEVIGKTISLYVPASSRVDQFIKGQINVDAAEAQRAMSDQQIAWVNALEKTDRINLHFNTKFFTQADSRQPEQAGFLGSIVGSLWTLLVCFALAFPLGVGAAVYLEEFARKNWITDVIEVNINNLAAVPSIVFGLLGLSLYIGVMHMPRSAPVVGGLTLALMILPVIIISTRTALAAVPDSIRHGALALGATKLQMVMHHTLPLSMPGVMTGTILGLARAIGETAPLLMIGMVAFVADVPGGVTDPATVMPVQIFLWATSPEAGYVEKTAAGILVLLAILLAMNAAAIYIRKKFEVRW